MRMFKLLGNSLFHCYTVAMSSRRMSSSSFNAPQQRLSTDAKSNCKRTIVDFVSCQYYNIIIVPAFPPSARVNTKLPGDQQNLQVLHK